MMRMQPSHRRFLGVLAILWLILPAAGAAYAHLRDIPAAVALAVIPAFLVEAGFYVATGFGTLREGLEKRYSKYTLSLLLTASALVPYLTYTLPVGCFSWRSVVLLAAAAALASFWYCCLPRKPLTDISFVAFMAAVVLGKLFNQVYASPAEDVPLEILGQLMWIRLGVMAALSLRGMKGVGFGFLPTASEWKAGLRHYLYFLPLGFPLAMGLGVVRFNPVSRPLWTLLFVALGTFLGMLWVVALSEEFFFRGLLQQWFTSWFQSADAALVLTSVLFGLVHLPFRGFPNWKFAIVAALAGWFYGRAFRNTGSIRASMVAHALVNTTWRLLFT